MEKLLVMQQGCRQAGSENDHRMMLRPAPLEQLDFKAGFTAEPQADPQWCG